MRPVALDTALSAASIAAGQLQYLGSFIAHDHPTFYHSRSLADITPASMRDPFAGILYACLEKHVGSEDFDFTPRKIAHALIEDGYINGVTSDVDVALDNLTKRLEALAASGARNHVEFRRKEALLMERLRSDVAATADKQFAAIMKAADGRTYAEKLQAIEALAREMRGQFVQTSRNMDVTNITDLASGMRFEAEGRLGHIKLTYPPQFGDIHRKLFPQRKEMVVISGPSGGGKSILLHTWAEWVAECGFRCLMIMTEDSLELTLARATARHIPHTTWMEVAEEGDPKHKKEAYIALTQEWLKRGGEIVYRERPGIGGVECVNLVEGECNDAQAQGRPFDFIFIDYVADLDFEQDVMQKFYTNPVAAAAACAVKLRGIAQKRNAVMVCATQESGSDNTDDVHTYGSRRTTQKAQQWLSFVRPKAPRDIEVFDNQFNGGKPRKWVSQGEEMPLLFLVVRKANRFQKGYRVPLFLYGPGQQVYDKDYYTTMRDNPGHQFPLPIYTAAGDDFYKMQKRTEEVYGNAVETIKAEEFDPIRKQGKHIPA